MLEGHVLPKGSCRFKSCQEHFYKMASWGNWQTQRFQKPPSQDISVQIRVRLPIVDFVLLPKLAAGVDLKSAVVKRPGSTPGEDTIF